MSPQSNLVLIRIRLILFVQSTCNKVKGLRARSYKKVTKKILSCKTNPAEPILLGKLLPGDDERDDGADDYNDDNDDDDHHHHDHDGDHNDAANSFKTLIIWEETI